MPRLLIVGELTFGLDSVPIGRSALSSAPTSAVTELRAVAPQQ